MKSTKTGFTVTELMIVIAIAAILFAIATPAMRGIIANQRADSILASLSASIRLARIEAMRRGVDVIVCASNGAASPDCSTLPADWVKGWLVKVQIPNKKEIIQISPPLPANSIQSNPSTTCASLTLTPLGTLKASACPLIISPPGCKRRHQLRVSYPGTAKITSITAVCPGS